MPLAEAAIPPEATTRTCGGRIDDVPGGRVLLVVSRSDVGVHVLPRAGVLTVGRSARCDIPIDDDTVSRFQLKIHLGPDEPGAAPGVQIEDLHSHNGTLIRNQRLATGRRHRIAIGDIVTIGAVNLVLQPRPSDAMLAARPLRSAGPTDPVIVNPRMIELHDRIARIAASELSVVLLGETGVGKEIIAETIHRRSARAAAPFVRINCGALAPSLLESELFGYEKGAFTGAERTKPGLFEAAHTGTVFLDEIGEMPVDVQIRLLRVLEERKVLRVGGVEARAIDVRVIAATNRDLKAQTASGRFRRDLYYRINGISLHVPPLRERPDEIVPLARHFLAGFARDLMRPVPALATAVADALAGHAWPGNVRELRNAMLRAIVLCERPVIEVDQLPLILDDAPELIAPASAGEAGERQRILDALEQCAGNQSRAARRLGISRTTLLKRLDQYQIARPRRRGEPTEGAP